MSRFHRKTLCMRYLLMVLIISLSSWVSATDNLPLNGIDAYDHMGKDYYWVSHTTTLSCQTAEACQKATAPARFRLKIITKRWTAQNFNLVWQRELASNNQKLPANFDMQALIDFTQLPKTPLTKGDTIDIVFDGKDTLISINNAVAQRSQGKTLFNYLSNIWIGSVPPSRRFRSNMLQGHEGEHSQDKLIAFKTLKMDESRLGLLKEWQTQKSDEALSDANKKKNAKDTELDSNQTNDEIALKLPTPKPSPNKVPPKPSVSTVTQTTAAITTQVATQTRPTSNANNSGSRSDTPNVIERLTSATSTIPKTAIPKKDSRVAVQQAPVEIVKPPKNTKKRNTSPTQPKPTTQQANAIFEWRLFNAIRQAVEYPAWAKQLKQEGDVTVTFELDKKLKAPKILTFKPTYAGLLADAVIDAIQTIDIPNTYWPQKVSGPITFQYQHTFSLNQKSASQKNISSDLKKFLPLKETQRKLAVSDNDLKKYLSDNVEYPYWAKSMKLKGKVSASITLGNKGNILNIKLTQKSRHNDLNKALVDAIQKAEPFPISLPSGKTSRQFDYTHSFRP